MNFLSLGVLFVLLFFFPVGDGLCLITLSSEHEFLFRFLSGYSGWFWLRKRPQASDPNGLSCFVQTWLLFLVPWKALRHTEKKTACVYGYVSNMCIYIPRGFRLMLFKRRIPIGEKKNVINHEFSSELLSRKSYLGSLGAKEYRVHVIHRRQTELSVKFFQ